MGSAGAAGTGDNGFTGPMRAGFSRVTGVEFAGNSKGADKSRGTGVTDGGIGAVPGFELAGVS